MISIIIPTYNRPFLLERLLYSITNQTYKFFEVIIINDNSTLHNSRYKKLIYKFSRLLPELHYFVNDINRGANYCRNIGLMKAKYEYVAFVDDDDEWLPTKLERQINVFNNSNKNTAIVYSYADIINQNGETIYKYRNDHSGTTIKEIFSECFIPSPTVVVRKDVCFSVNGFDEKLQSCQDWDMWTRILLGGYQCKVVKSVEAIHHKHELPSIGKSKNAVNGYKRYLKKHFFSMLRHGFIIQIIDQLKYIIKVSIKIEK